VAEKFTTRGAWPVVGEAVAVQVRVQGGDTMMLPVLVQATPWTVTVMLQLYVPAEVYVWLGFCWVELPPSPKFQA
jgi:hypothetical protein